MKLYKEEQMAKVWMAGQKYWETSGASITFEELLESEKSIELPSDEEIGLIALNIASTLKDGLDSREEAFYLAGFQTCAKWMKEQILNQNK